MILAGLRTAAILLITVAASAAAWAGGVLSRSERWPAAVMRWWGRALVRAGGWTLRTDGGEHLPPGGAVVAANHGSYLDIPLLLAALPRDIKFVAKEELGRIPLFGRAMTLAGNLFVDRDDPRDAVRLVREASGRMRGGQLIVIFPEGTRSPDGTLGAFRPGAFFLAQKTGAPLVPVLIGGTAEALPRGRRIVRPAVLSARILPPVAGPGGASLSREEMAAETRRRLAEARGEGSGARRAVPCPG